MGSSQELWHEAAAVAAVARLPPRMSTALKNIIAHFVQLLLSMVKNAGGFELVPRMQMGLIWPIVLLQIMYGP